MKGRKGLTKTAIIINRIHSAFTVSLRGGTKMCMLLQLHTGDAECTVDGMT